MRSFAKIKPSRKFPDLQYTLVHVKYKTHPRIFFFQITKIGCVVFISVNLGYNNFRVLFLYEPQNHVLLGFIVETGSN